VKRGDLVEVAYPRRCGCEHDKGYTYYVAGVKTVTAPCCCAFCGKTMKTPDEMAVEMGTSNGFEVYRLRVIPPPSLTEETRKEEEQPA
jgi:hypothetical protein